MRNARGGALAAILAAAMMASAAWAAPLDPGLQAQLLQIYDSYNKAIGAGRLEEAMAMRSREVRGEARKEMAVPSRRKELLQFSQMTVPDTVEFKRAKLSKDGATATLLVVARKTVPRGGPPGGPPPGSVAANEVTLTFVKETGAWKFDESMFGPDPGAIAPCKNEAFEPIDAYDQGDDVSMSMGGPIDRVVFEKDYTLVVVRVVDEDNCAYLPSRADIAKSGQNPDLLVPYAIISIGGFPHKSDKQKIWAVHFSVNSDDD